MLEILDLGNFWLFCHSRLGCGGNSSSFPESVLLCSCIYTFWAIRPHESGIHFFYFVRVLNNHSNVSKHKHFKSTVVVGSFEFFVRVGHIFMLFSRHISKHSIDRS